MLSYAVFYWLTRIPPIGALFAWTTLTRAYSRYHEPETKASDLTEMPRDVAAKSQPPKDE